MTPEERAEYRRPGEPVKYGEGDPLPEEDREFLRGLQKRHWRAFPPDRLGRVGYRPEGTMTARDLEKVFNLIVKHRLMTTIGSGMFGLSGYSMQVFDHPEPSMVEERPQSLLTLISDHIKTRHHKDQQKHWAFFTRFTHSPENLALLDYYKMPRPRNREDYDY